MRAFSSSASSPVRRLSPRIPEALFLFAVVFSPLAFGSTRPWSTAVVEIDLFLLFAACVLRGGAEGGGLVGKTLLPAVLGLLLLGVLQLLNPRSSLGPASLLPFTAAETATRHDLLLWSSYAALLWSAPQVLADRDARRRFAWTLFGLGVLVAVVGVMQRGQGNGYYYGLFPVREGGPFGPFVNRDHAGAFLAMSACVGGGLFLSRWTGLRERRASSAKIDLAAAQALLLFVLGVTAFAVWDCRSRGGLNSFVLSLEVVSLTATGFIRRPGPRWTARAILFAAGLAYALFLVSHPIYFGDLFQTPDASTALRLSFYRSSVAFLRDFPLWGTGLGSTRAAFRYYAEPLALGTHLMIDHVHSDWLEFGLEGGLFALLALGAGLGSFLFAILRDWRRELSFERRCLIAGALAAAVSFVLHEAVDFCFRTPADAVAFLSVLCYLGALLGPKEPVAGRPAPVPLRAGAAAAALALAVLCVPPAASWIYLRRMGPATPAARALLAAKAQAWEQTPETRFQLGAAALLVAESAAGAPARARLLRAALPDLEAAWSRAPLDRRYNAFLGEDLDRLGSNADAGVLLRRARLLGQPLP
ncbi:MAG: O-antigen ligase family protein [Elusimicrobia bacterium]|nr:O-antigen ligase family protein [Elusimicrobiota bacterium]